MKISRPILLTISVFVLPGPATAQQPDLALNPVASSRLEDLKAFAERPLFAISRRPQAAEPITREILASDTVEPKPDFVLLGITTGPDGSIARIRAGGDEPSRSLRTGENVEGWTVQSIDASTATLHRDLETIILSIFLMNEAVEEKAEDAGPGIVFEPADSKPEPQPRVRVIHPK